MLRVYTKSNNVSLFFVLCCLFCFAEPEVVPAENYDPDKPVWTGWVWTTQGELNKTKGLVTSPTTGVGMHYFIHTPVNSGIANNTTPSNCLLRLLTK